MVVNRSLLWVLLGACCIPSVVMVVRMRLRDTRAGLLPLADALLTGLAIGLALACGVVGLGAASQLLLDW